MVIRKVLLFFKFRFRSIFKMETKRTEVQLTTIRQLLYKNVLDEVTRE